MLCLSALVQPFKIISGIYMLYKCCVLVLVWIRKADAVGKNKLCFSLMLLSVHVALSKLSNAYDGHKSERKTVSKTQYLCGINMPGLFVCGSIEWTQGNIKHSISKASVKHNKLWQQNLHRVLVLLLNNWKCTSYLFAVCYPRFPSPWSAVNYFGNVHHLY